MANFPLLKELKRRNVLRASLLYTGAVWALAQGISQLGPTVGAPAWVTQWFLAAGIIGFPFWLAFAWFFELTPSGLKREDKIDPTDPMAHRTSRKLNIWIFGVMALAIVSLLTNQFVLDRRANDTTAADPTPMNNAPSNSIAILPFTNESSDVQQEYFADGIAEDLLNLLARVQPLQVACRTSSFAFKNSHLTIPEIATKLHVANVLEGSVRKVGDEVRISAQLVRASDGYEIWSRSYDRQLTDIFAIQDVIAADVVKNLRIKLLGAVPTVRVTDPKTYTLYLQARQLGNTGAPDAFKSSIALLQQPLATDPQYAPAWNELARDYVDVAGTSALSLDQGLRQAREASEKALTVDPDFAPAEAMLGYIAMEQNDLPTAARHLQRAQALDPNDLGVLGDSAGLLQTLGRLQPAISVNEYIVARDPVNPARLFNLAPDYLYAGRYDEAIARYRSVLSLSPGFSGAHTYLGEALLLKGDARAALVQMQQEKSEEQRLFGVALAWHALGQNASSDAALKTLTARYAKENPYDIASVHAYRGEVDSAFEWADRAMQDADLSLPHISIDPLLNRLHADPRWLPLLRKAGYAHEQLAMIKFTVKLPGASEPESAISDTTLPARPAYAAAATSIPAQARMTSTGKFLISGMRLSLKFACRGYWCGS